MIKEDDSDVLEDEEVADKVALSIAKIRKPSKVQKKIGGPASYSWAASITVPGSKRNLAMESQTKQDSPKLPNTSKTSPKIQKLPKVKKSPKVEIPQFHLLKQTLERQQPPQTPSPQKLGAADYPAPSIGSYKN